MNEILSKITQPTTLLLILANLIPLAGVVILGWQVFPLMLLFWVENVIVGLLNMIKMLMVDPGNPKVWASKLFMIPFFCFHYGIFTAVHGVFVFALFGGSFFESQSPGIEDAPDMIWNLGLVWAIACIAASHFVSFVINYWRGGEYQRSTLEELMRQPYGRVIILHMTILGGGFLMMMLGSPVWGLVLLVIAKIILDLIAHVREHKPRSQPAGNMTV
jgi:hypothetical protein